MSGTGNSLEQALGTVALPEDAAQVLGDVQSGKPKKLRPDKASAKKGRDGQFYWFILSANGKDIKADGGEGYKTKGGALNALRKDQARWAQPGGLVIYDDPEALKPKKKAKKALKKLSVKKTVKKLRRKP